MAGDRPIIALYEPIGVPADEQELVHRPMTDDELAEYEEMLASAETPAQRPAVLAMVDELTDDERAELRALLDT